MKIRSMLALGLLSLPLAPAAATAGALEDRLACMNDALTVCAQFIPNRGRIESCLFANRSLISQACQTVLARSREATVSPAALTDPPLKFRYCPNSEPYV